MNEQRAPEKIQEIYHLHIQPRERNFRLKLNEVWKYRDLVFLLAKKTFTMTYQQTVLGPLWIVLHPVFSCLIYLFVFTYISHLGTNGTPEFLFYFISSSAWELFSYSLITNSETFLSNNHLFSKVYFPRLAVPFSAMIVSLWKFLFQLVIIIILVAVSCLKGAIRPVWLYFPLLPVLFVQLSFTGLSIGVLFSSLTTKYRDLMHVVRIAVTMWMFGSAVVYPLSSIPDGVIKTIIRCNPVSMQMELIRLILLGKGDFNLPVYLAGLAVTVVLFILGVFMFNRVERTFADTV